MAQEHARSGQVVGLRPWGERLQGASTTAILKSAQLELVRVVLPAGKRMKEHSAPGEITVLCIEGQIEFETPEGLQLLAPGDLIHLRAGEPHALLALEDSSALVTLCLVRP